MMLFNDIPSLKLKAIAPENQWLEDDSYFLVGGNFGLFSGINSLVVSGRLIKMRLGIYLMQIFWCVSRFNRHLTNEKKPGYLLYIGDYTTQLYEGYNEPL